MRIYDITVTITPDLPVWPGDPKVVLERVARIEDGANANVSRVAISAHTGTHVDAPYHFLPDGSKVEAMPLEILTGPALVVQIGEDIPVLSREVLEKTDLPPGAARILFKTRNSRYWAQFPKEFKTDFVGITKDGAEYLVGKGVQLVGIDYLSIAPYKQSRPTHEVLLGAGMVVIEGLDLSEVEPGSYLLYCLPLKLGGADGAPARTILVRED